MKKFFAFVAVALVALSANAYELNNPVGEDGRYIVKYDCAAGQFAAANDFEVDEAVTIAVDVKGTWLEEWLKDTPVAEGATRGVAINNWTNYGDTDSNFRRFKQIEGTVYGLTMKLSDLMVTPENALMTDSVVYMYAQLFGFEYTEVEPGANWWMWVGEVATTEAPGSDCFFATLPYTGTKTSETFYADDFGLLGVIFGFTLPSYAAPCALDEAQAIEHVAVAPKTRKVVEGNQLFLISNGVRYNVLGAIVK